MNYIHTVLQPTQPVRGSSVTGSLHSHSGPTALIFTIHTTLNSHVDSYGGRKTGEKPSRQGRERHIKHVVPELRFEPTTFGTTAVSYEHFTATPPMPPNSVFTVRKELCTSTSCCTFQYDIILKIYMPITKIYYPTQNNKYIIYIIILIVK
jgi:hypothetical protein